MPPSPRFPVRLTLTAEASPPSERLLLPSDFGVSAATELVEVQSNATRIAEIEEGDSRETVEEVGLIHILHHCH